MITVTVLYANSPDAKFDMDYYLTSHMPMVRQRLAPALRASSAEQGIGGGEPGAPAPYIALCHLNFDSVEAFQGAFSPHAEEILADVPKYTSVQPTFQISEIKPIGSATEASDGAPAMHHNEALWHAVVEAYFVLQDDARLAELTAPDMVLHIPGNNRISGVRPLREYFGTIKDVTGGDLQLEVLEILASDDRIASFYRVKMDRDGASLGYEAHNTYRVVDGKLAEAWIYPVDLAKFDEFYA